MYFHPKKKKNSFQSFFFFFLFLLSQSKSLNYKTTFTMQLYCSTMCWRGLLLLKYSHSLKKKKNCIFIVQPSVVRGLPTIDQIFSFIKSEQIIKDLRAKEVNQPEYGHVLQDSLVLASFFWVCSFSHVKRVSNSVAHFFARRSKLGNELQVWLDSLPDDLAPFALRDFL